MKYVGLILLAIVIITTLSAGYYVIYLEVADTLEKHPGITEFGPPVITDLKVLTGVISGAIILTSILLYIKPDERFKT